MNQLEETIFVQTFVRSIELYLEKEIMTEKLIHKAYKTAVRACEMLKQISDNRSEFEVPGARELLGTAKDGKEYVLKPEHCVHPNLHMSIDAENNNIDGLCPFCRAQASMFPGSDRMEVFRGVYSTLMKKLNELTP